MKTNLFIIFLLFVGVFCSAQNPNRVKLRDLQNPPASTSDFVIFAVNDTAGWKQITEYNGDTVIIWHPTLKKFAFIHKDSIATPLPADNVTGNGTTNYLTKFTGTYTIGDANLTDNGTILDALLPLRLKTYTTAGLPISSGGHTVYNSTTSNIAFGGVSTWEYPVKSAYSTGLFTATRVPYADANGRLTDNSNFIFSGSTVSAPIFSSSNFILIQSSGPGFYFRRATSQRWFFLVAGSVGAQFYSPYGYGGGDFLISNEATSASDIWDIVYFKRKFASTNMRSPRIWQESYYTTTTTGVAESYGWGVQRTASSKNQNYYSLFYRRDSTQQWDNGSQFAVQSPTEIFRVSPSGQVRIIDLTPTPTRIVGADADGDLGQITLGSGLSLSAGTLSATGSYSGFTPAADATVGDTIASGDTLSVLGGFGVNTSVSGTTVTIEADTSELATQYDVAQAQDGNGIFSVQDSQIIDIDNKVYRDSTNGVFGIGYFPGFPDIGFNEANRGLLLSHSYYNDIGLFESIDGIGYQVRLGSTTELSVKNLLNSNNGYTSVRTSINRGVTFLGNLPDSSGLYSYEFPRRNPSSTSGLKSTMAWTGNGSTTTPSFTIPTFFTQTANGAVTNTVTETTVTASGVGTLTIPANYLEAGRTIVIKGTGYITNNSSVTLRMRAKLGGTTIGDTQAQTLENLGAANENFHFEYTFTCRSTGASGTIIGQGLFRYCPATGGLVPCQEFDMVNTSTTTINTTTTNTIDVTAQWGAASTDNNIVLTNLIVEAKN